MCEIRNPGDSGREEKTDWYLGGQSLSLVLERTDRRWMLRLFEKAGQSPLNLHSSAAGLSLNHAFGSETQSRLRVVCLKPSSNPETDIIYTRGQ